VDLLLPQALEGALVDFEVEEELLPQLLEGEELLE
jgi:hypothetical protein